MYSITRTFASGKTEKMVMQCLKDLGFASGKVRTSPVFGLTMAWMERGRESRGPGKGNFFPAEYMGVFGRGSGVSPGW